MALSRSRSWSRIAFVALTAFMSLSPAQAAEVAAEPMLEACRAAASGETYQNTFLEGVCVGKLDTAAWLASGINGHLRSCPPSDASSAQLAKVVVLYLDRNPARLNEPLTGVALVAFKEVWPCP